LGLIADQALFNLIETVVNITLQNLILAGVMTNTMVIRLLLQVLLVLADELTDDLESLLLLLELLLKLIDLSEFVLHLVLHLVHAISDSLHFLVDPGLKVADLLQVSGPSLDFDLKFGCGHLSVVELALLEVEILFHLVNLVPTWHFALSAQILGHMF